jgi:hypothetical protein
MKPAARVFALAVIVGDFTAASLVAQQRADAARVKQQFIGSYRLVWYVTFDQNGAERKTSYTVGQISYDAAGRMSAQLMASDRPQFSGTSVDEAQRATAYSTYIAYFGRYEVDVDKGVVMHHVEGGLRPSMVGTAMPRYFEFSPDGNTLFLATKSGDRMTGRLRWERHR